MSRMKPKVRARLTSLTKEVVEKSISALDVTCWEHRVVEIDREADLEAVERLEARPLVAVVDLDRLA